MKSTTLLHRPFTTSRLITEVEPVAELPLVADEATDVMAHEPFSCMYVYLTSGAVEVVPFVSAVTLSDRTVTVRGGGGPPVEYPRAEVYLVSREPISPPVLF